MPRVIWKGAISFGLVHVPVALYPASQETGIDFDWLDKRSMDPVGYKRVNKRTGKEIESANIVKGIQQESGDYVVLSEDEIKAAYPKSTQTIEIETFIEADQISFPYLEKPFFLTPIGKGDKVYALLREAMLEAGVIGIARVVMHTKERLAALMPFGQALMLNTIRWSSELRSSEELTFPPAGKAAAGLKEGELKMARQLINDMTHKWKPDDYADRFTASIKALAAQRVDAGKTEKVTPLEGDAPEAGASNVVDLTELLKRSLDTRGSPRSGAKAGGSDKPAAKSDKPAEKPAAKGAAKPPPVRAKAAHQPSHKAARKRA
jgi:DNA end-binding protein Ku